MTINGVASCCWTPAFTTNRKVCINVSWNAATVVTIGCVYKHSMGTFSMPSEAERCDKCVPCECDVAWRQKCYVAAEPNRIKIRTLWLRSGFNGRSRPEGPGHLHGSGSAPSSISPGRSTRAISANPVRKFGGSPLLLRDRARRQGIEERWILQPQKLSYMPLLRSCEMANYITEIIALMGAVMLIVLPRKF